MKHLFLLVVLLQCPAASGLFEWLKQTTEVVATPSPPPPPQQASETRIRDVPFEMAVADEKFLAEGRQMDLSPLDSCHSRVIGQLRSTCGSLSEEQLAKLGVVLFNCQAEVEGRRTYPCTEEMTLKQCTSDMDADTWNAYHIVSNRARSVCYATRQLQFRRRAELTVNALISTATSQLDAMKDLKEGQLELRELTSASLDKVLQGHSALQSQQVELWKGQEQLESSLSSNLKHLSQEKALIASGQELVAQLIQGITQRMENVSEQLKDQGSEVQDSHQAIIQELADVRERAQDVNHKIDSSMEGFLQYQNRTAAYYSDLMAKLERINGTLGTLFLHLDNMQYRLEERLHVIQGYLGWAGLSLAAMWTCIVHTCYFLLGAVLLAFLGCPLFTRAMLLLTVPLNAVAELNQQPALDLKSLSLLILTLSLGHWFVKQLLWAYTQLKVKPASLPPCKIVETEKHDVPSYHRCPSSTPERDQLDGSMEADLVDQDDCLNGVQDGSLAPDLLDQDGCLNDEILKATLSFSNDHPMPEARFVPIMSTPGRSTPKFIGRLSQSTALMEELRNLGSVFDAECEFRSSSPNHSLTSNGSMSGRQLCNGITKTGKACKKRAVQGQDYCRVHEGGYTSYVNP